MVEGDGREEYLRLGGVVMVGGGGYMLVMMVMGKDSELGGCGRNVR